MSQKIKIALVLDYVILFFTHYEHTFDSNKFLGHFTTEFVILFASDILLIKKSLPAP